MEEEKNGFIYELGFSENYYSDGNFDNFHSHVSTMPRQESQVADNVKSQAHYSLISKTRKIIDPFGAHQQVQVFV